ncbi:MAG: ATP-binding protein [Bacteroidia bacterium]
MIGREPEISIMHDLLITSKSEMLSVFGRRRVGKTYLIREVYKNEMIFDFVGTQFSNKKTQLQKFADKLSERFNGGIPIKRPASWYQAFETLKGYLDNLPKTKKKRVIFFDELPWIDSHRSGFLQEFGYWWNDWASKKNLVVVICGSAASWMIRKVINHKGGLHNRVTQQIHLKPFTLYETQKLLQSKNINLPEYHILQLYMITGGVPHYLENVQRGESASQTIDRMCFTKDGILQSEFNNLYNALYDYPENHIKVIRALAESRTGLTRSDIQKKTGIATGGGLTKVLEELEQSSFISSLSPIFKSSKETLYRLVDEYSLFYLNFIEKQKLNTSHIWQSISQEQRYVSWCGYAFENVCIRHVNAIKNALNIGGIRTQVGSFYRKKTETEEGFQIDLLIERADKGINICEMKFYADDLIITEQIATTLRKRRESFRRHVKKKKYALFNTIITPFGVVDNKWKLDQMDNVITAKDLFQLTVFE